MDTYRGYDIHEDEAGFFFWADENGNVHARFQTPEAAMDDIDSYRRQLRAQSNDRN